MPLSLFGYEPPCQLRDTIGSRGEYAHTFGGRAADFGLKFRGAHPLQLIYRLDLSDPLLAGVAPELPGVQFLPLFYSFGFDPECSYRVKATGQVQLVTPRKPNPSRSPWKGAPAGYPLRPTSFAARPYDASRAEDALRLKGIFGWEGLSAVERARAVEIARDPSGYTMENAIDENWTYDDVIDCMFDPPFRQGKPGDECPNPDCQAESLRVIAIQDRPVKAELIWHDEFAQTIWQWCGACGCIVASNQAGQSPLEL